MAGWSIRDIPAQTGRRSVITGATGGLGYDTALALAAAGGEVILTGRNPAKGADAVARIKRQHPAAAIRFELLDLANLASITDFAGRFAAAHGSLDLLVNNAGVMALPQRLVTSDGFEMQFGTNHLGHFALTGRLLPLLRGGRVVSVSSLAARVGVIAFDNLQGERRYRPMQAYAQSKLANLMFAIELQHRSAAQGWGVTSVAAHPGFSSTDLIANSRGPDQPARIQDVASGFVVRLIGQSSAAGALPSLYAATVADVQPGGFYGPDGGFELKGAPGPAKITAKARDTAVASRLWDVSSTLTGVVFLEAALAAH
jgi:NAD(P)-dependent dehydrogenase (short-subunit alcohol dehydrogenase family)